MTGFGVNGNMEFYTNYYQSEIGLLEIRGSEQGIVSISFVESRQAEGSSSHPLLEDCIVQLDEYFQGTRWEFSVALGLQGTDFQKQVWQYLLTIPYGQTVSYHDVALALGKPQGNQAVGNANGKNPIAIIIPCHRVLGSNGKLTGYGGGLWRKEWLLRHEGALIV